MRIFSFAGTMCIVPLFCAAQTTVPTTLPEVLVTPQELMIDEPQAVSRLTGEELARREIDDFDDLQSVVPNNIARSGGTRSLNQILGFRGLVNNAFFGEPAVALYVDDVAYGSTLTYDPDFQNIERLDVFRGPQFTRYGRRGASGLISMYTREPGDRLRFNGAAGFASHDEQFYKLTIDGPLGPQFGFSLSGTHSRRDGYLYNRRTHESPDFAEAFSGRFSLHWRPSERLDVQLILSGQRYYDGVQRFTNVDSSPFVVDHDFTGITEGSSDLQALRVRYRGDDVLFTSVTARRHWRLNPQSFDIDFLPLPIATIMVLADQLQYSQEFRLQSRPGADLDWLLGAYASWAEQEVEVRDELIGFTTPQVGQHSFTDNSFALFGEVTKNVVEKLDVTVGVRGEYIEKDVERVLRTFGGSVVEGARDRTISNVSPKLQLTWRFDEDFKIYGSTALSYRSGAYSVFNTNPEINSSDTERTWANEIGAKAQLLGGKVELALAAFWYEIDEYQIERYLLTGFGISTANEVVSRGVELELVARPFRGLQLSAGVGYTDARFTSHRSAETGEDASGHRPPYIPDVTANFSADYKHSSGMMGRIDWLLTGRTYFEEANLKSVAQNAYGIVNAKVGYEHQHWGVYVYGKNLGDTEYYTFKFHPFGVGVIGEPRSVGMMLTFNF